MTVTRITPLTVRANGEMQKSQLLRLIDVAILGPFLIYASMDKTPPKLLRQGLMIAGIATILYNGKNLLANSRP